MAVEKERQKIKLVHDDENNETKQNRKAQRKFVNLHLTDKRKYPIPGTKAQFKGTLPKAMIQPNRKDAMKKMKEAVSFEDYLEARKNLEEVELMEKILPQQRAFKKAMHKHFPGKDFEDLTKDQKAKLLSIVDRKVDAEDEDED